MDIELIYENLIKDKEIIDIYNNIEEYERATNGFAYHNLNHILNVTNLVEQVLKSLDYSNVFITKAKIACLLHDVGALQGKDNHALRSYEFAKEYFKNNNIVFDDLHLVLEAIRIHSDGFETNNIIALALILADKLDIKKTRVAPGGLKLEGMRQMIYIEDIKIDIFNNFLKVNFITDKNIDIVELSNYYFIKKVFKAIEAFANKLNLDYDILMNNEKWLIN